MKTVKLDGHTLTLDDVRAVARGAKVALAPEARKAVRRARAVVERALAEPDAVVYGVNTGFGELSRVRIGAGDLGGCSNLSFACLRRRRPSPSPRRAPSSPCARTPSPAATRSGTLDPSSRCSTPGRPKHSVVGRSWRSHFPHGGCPHRRGSHRAAPAGETP
jgi:hypothetical protein